MNKVDLAIAVAERTGMSKKDAEIAINATMEAVTKALANGDKVQLVGFGSFETKMRAAFTGHDPRTLEPIEIAATRVPCFKPGKGLKEAVANK